MNDAEGTIEVFFDGECPLCAREINMLRNMDKGNQIAFTDIASSSFSAASYGQNMDTLMGSMHVRLADGTWIEGVESFRRLYGTLGFTSIVRLTRLPGVKTLLDWGYARFANNRLRLTGRCEDATCKADR